MSQPAMDIQRVITRYAEAAEPIQSDDRFQLQLPTDAQRPGARAQLQLKRPGVTRDGLLTLIEVLASDLRFKARDRADYLAYLLQQGKSASMELWNAQKAFLAEKYGEKAGDEGPLDPIVEVAADGVAMEVFSADESAYARLFLANEAYDATGLSAGVSHLALSPQLADALRGMRSYRASTLTLGPGEGGSEQARDVPYRWIRAFGQVQAAATLPAVDVELSPVDVYNVLFSLRSQRAKKSPRALRYELVPGEAPRLVLEPWDLVIEGCGGPYEGAEPRVVRTWGRRRLMVLARLLPHAKRMRVRLLGAGLPTYYILDLGDATFTLALSGWTDSGWAGIATFDLLVADPTKDEVLPRKLLGALEDKGPQPLDALAESAGRKRGEVRAALLWEMQKGRLLYDPATDHYRRRDLFADPLDAHRLRYRDDREREAHRLLAEKGAVTITRIEDLGGEGVRIEGEVDDAQAHRSYTTSFTLDREGRTVAATCTSPQYRRSGLKEGPTIPMIALRLAYARQQAELEKARNTPEGRALIVAETRSYVRRAAGRNELYRVSLDHRQVLVRWGDHPDRMRLSRLFFPDPEQARHEYFSRLDSLAQRGFIDASSAEAVS